MVSSKTHLNSRRADGVRQAATKFTLLYSRTAVTGPLTNEWYSRRDFSSSLLCSFLSMKYRSLARLPVTKIIRQRTCDPISFTLRIAWYQRSTRPGAFETCVVEENPAIIPRNQRVHVIWGNEWHLNPLARQIHKENPSSTFHRD